MFLAQASSSSVSASPEALQAAAQNAVVQTGADQAADTAQNLAQQAAAQIPQYLEWVKHFDMFVALGVFAALAVLFYTVAKNMTAVFVLGASLAYILAVHTPLFTFLPTISTAPDYLVRIGAFVLLSFIIARTLFVNMFFEPMNLPTGKEVPIFALAAAGFLIACSMTWWPADQIQTFSDAFQFFFTKEPARSIWLASPVIVAIAMRGKF